VGFEAIVRPANKAAGKAGLFELPSLAVSVVTYATNLPDLAQTLVSLERAVGYAKNLEVLGSARLFFIDNGPGDVWRHQLQDILADANRSGRFDTMELLSGHGNIGYGAGHNLAIRRNVCDFHLILNPDVLLAENALLQALAFMAAHPDAGLLTPAVVDGLGNRQYLCKRYPAVLDLLLRGFAPSFFKQLFKKRLDRYELRDLLGDAVVWDMPIVSGCFMLFRRSVLTQVQGFSPAYFLYFEDFDISLRTARVARTAYVPTVRITHFGGHAAKKGRRHIGMFLRSAFTFFNQHGWKWV